MFTTHRKKETRKEVWPTGIIREKTEVYFYGMEVHPRLEHFTGATTFMRTEIRKHKREIRGKVLLRNAVGFQVVSYPLPSAEVGVCTTLVCCPGTGALALLIRRSNLVLLQVLEQTLSCW